MNNIALLEKSVRRVVAANSLVLLAAFFCVSALPCQAGQSSAQFAVTINLQNSAAGVTPPAGGGPSNPATGLCQSGSGIGTFGSTVTVVCATGTLATFAGDATKLPWLTVPDNAFRYMLNVYQGSELLGMVDSNTGVGTVTSWRVVNLNNQDYLEMMLHW